LNPDWDLRLRFDGLEIETLSVLDLGCGYNRNRISRAVLKLPFRHLTSVDIHYPCLDALRDRPVAAREHNIVHCEILSYLSFPGVCPDVTLLLDVLEHFEPDDAMRLLAAVHAVTRKRIIIFLPIGECPQDAYDDNPYQIHRSTWAVEDLLELGFAVEHMPCFHKNLRPQVDAAWAVKNL